jgi:threonine aldolase
LNLPVSRVVEKADSVMFCLSKGLGAPVGSMLAGRQSDIEKGRLYRKRLGGGMRQAGILAAAGLIALEKMPARLSEDHANARFLADGIAGLPGMRVPNPVETNIVIFDISGTGFNSTEYSQALLERGILANGVGPQRMRMVTHYDVTREMCDEALRVMRSLVRVQAQVS